MNPQTQEDLKTFRNGVAAASSHPLVPKPAVQALQAAGRLLEQMQADVQALREEVQACQRCRQSTAGVVPFPGIDPALIAPQNGAGA